ncbi:MAG: hypothetical protein MZV63_59240 [Marinilabiliales bacterium]|nr:hypothetical protein [Marinilabiliales bacterium]
MRRSCRSTLPELEKSLSQARTASRPSSNATDWLHVTDSEGRHGKTRDQHHAAVGRLMLVLPAIHRPEKRP